MPQLKLPIGIQSFAKMRRGGYAYVDKTPQIADLVHRGNYYFISRPRRFGKSLLVDTLDCAFSGRRELFEGLYLDSKEAGWDWQRKSPVLRIDFSGGTVDSRFAMEGRLHDLLDSWETDFDLDTTRPKGSPGDRLLALVPAIARATNEQVVILVDEYDKPILDNIEQAAAATEIRNSLRDFYGAIKPLDAHLRFVLLTGVTKFSKAGIFSGLNNLHDITLHRRYSTLCGYRQRDLETVFGERFASFDKQQVRAWYNGYSWAGEAVYNPYDILLLFDEGSYRPWWFETGTPTFLVKLLADKPRTLPDFEGMTVGSDLLGSFEIDTLQPETLLFQAGYLTVKDWSSDPLRGTRYRLGFPNREVREAYSALMLAQLTGKTDTQTSPAHRRERLWDIFDKQDPTALRQAMESFFSSIPYDWHTKNPIARYEGYYASVIYAFFASLGYEVIPEDTTNRGRADLTVKTPTSTWIFELKVKGLDKAGDTPTPLQQLEQRDYAKKYRASGRPIHEIGIVFDPQARSIESWETADRS
jgi:hypothetical protein